MIKVCKVQKHGMFGEMQLIHNYQAINNALCTSETGIYSVPRQLLVYVLQESGLLKEFESYVTGKNAFRKERIEVVEQIRNKIVKKIETKQKVTSVAMAGLAKVLSVYSHNLKGIQMESRIKQQVQLYKQQKPKKMVGLKEFRKEAQRDLHSIEDKVSRECL